MREKPVILVVDDDNNTIKLVNLMLKKNMDCQVVSASAGEEAIEAARQFLPDLILLDISMPEMDGYTVCKNLKKEDTFKETPIIFLSTLSEKKDIVYGLRMGAVDFISKPFFPQEFIARLQIHLQIQLQKQVIQRHLQENKELLQVLCHDLANPLGAVSGVLQFTANNDDLYIKYRSLIDSSVDSMVEIISLVRKFKAINDGKQKIDLTPVSLNSAIEQSIQTLNHRLTEKNIKVKSSIPENTIVLAEKTSLINSVLNNLVTNAIKFSFKDDEVSITAKKLDEEHVSVAIQDHGIGMPPKILQNLFNMNVPTSRPGTDEESGTGYGMPLVKKFVTLYDGEISIESIEKVDGVTDHGTTVNLVLKRPKEN